MTEITELLPTKPTARQPSRGEFLLVWLCVALVIAIGVFSTWQFWHTDRIFSGVHVAGVPVGGETRALALLRLRKELTPYPLAPIFLEHEGRKWALGAESLTPQADLEDAVNRAYSVGRQGGLVERVLDQWRALTGRAAIWPHLFFNEGAVRQIVSRAAQEVRRSSRPAFAIGEFSLPSRSGLDVDIAATAQLILAQAGSGQTGTVPLQTFSTVPPPASPVDALESAVAAPSSPFKPIVLRDERTGIGFALDAALLARLMPGGDPRSLNEEALRIVVAGWARQVSYPAQDARLRFDDATGRLTVLQPSAAGQRLNADLAIEAVRQALASDQRTAPLPIISVPPAVDSSGLDKLGIRELVASGTTYFGGSSNARVHNIEVAAEKIVGVVIPPDGIFSFNAAIEAVSGANGFEDSAIIWGDRTAIGVGGGVCQVSTTVFRAALAAGFPLLERHNHGYIVSWYGDPGFDATIYTPYVDFRFRNDTDAHLLIQPVVDTVAGILSFRFYGTKPDREVTISEAEQKDITPPSDPIYRLDASLEPGQIKQVEWAKEGMTTTVIRTVTQDGQSREDKIVSVYRPWSDMFLYGPGTVIPSVTDVEEEGAAEELEADDSEESQGE